MRTVSHAHAVAPFHVVEVLPRYCPSTDALIGTRVFPFQSTFGICTYGFAVLMAGRLSTDPDGCVEVRDSKGRTVFRDDKYDLRGRRLPKSDPAHSDGLCF